MQKQSNIFHYALIVVLLCMHVSLNAQELVNPSFEGVIGVARQPAGWIAYGNASSPDTQPGAWNVNKQSSHGNTYMSLVCRGYSIYDSYKWEAALQTLMNPLIAGETYHYSIDLAHSLSFLADTIWFESPAQLRVWGLNELQQKELLWVSGAIDNEDWKTYYFELTPTISVEHIVLEAYYVELPKYCGNVLVDNMKYYPVKPIIKEEVLELVDDNSEIPEEIDGRQINNQANFTFRGDKLTITVWDHRTTDGDVISLFLNKKNILEEFTISKNRLDVEVEVEEGQEYNLTLFAHNLGDIPPNTVALYISDGIRKKFITLTSDLESCGAVQLKIEQQLADFN